MEVSRHVMRQAAELLDAGVPFALCTVASVKGSVPGKVGAKMIVLADGTAFGTVGGAGLEEKTKALARRSLTERSGQTATFDLACFRNGGLDSLCGGTVEIFVEYMAARPHELAGYSHVVLLGYSYHIDAEILFQCVRRFPGWIGAIASRTKRKQMFVRL